MRNIVDRKNNMFDLDYRVIAVTLFLGLIVSIYTVTYIFSHSPRVSEKSELEYITNDGTGKRHKLPPRISPSSQLHDQTLDLSIIIPCYNETERIEAMLSDCFKYLNRTNKDKYEIIIVDDESKDGTSDYVIDLVNQWGIKPHIFKIIKLTKNRGKGGAVTHGVLHSAGKMILFADADGATNFADLDRLMDAFKTAIGPTAPGIAIGSRAHMVNTDAVVKRSFIRNFLMYGLHTLVYVFGIRKIKDTQCGFKLFNFESVQLIFPHMHTERWIFDVEVLLIASMQNIVIKEVPVNWREIEGSKVDLARDSIAMAIDLITTRIAYIVGIYRLNQNGRL